MGSRQTFPSVINRIPLSSVRQVFPFDSCPVRDGDDDTANFQVHYATQTPRDNLNHCEVHGLYTNVRKHEDELVDHTPIPSNDCYDKYEAGLIDQTFDPLVS